MENRGRLHPPLGIQTVVCRVGGVFRSHQPLPRGHGVHVRLGITKERGGTTNRGTRRHAKRALMSLALFFDTMA